MENYLSRYKYLHHVVESFESYIFPITCRQVGRYYESVLTLSGYLYFFTSVEMFQALCSSCRKLVIGTYHVISQFSLRQRSRIAIAPSD